MLHPRWLVLPALVVLLLASAPVADAASGTVKIIHNQGYAGITCSTGEAASPECSVAVEGEPSEPTGVEVKADEPVTGLHGEVKVIHGQG